MDDNIEVSNDDNINKEVLNEIYKVLEVVLNINKSEDEINNQNLIMNFVVEIEEILLVDNNNMEVNKDNEVIVLCKDDLKEVILNNMEINNVNYFLDNVCKVMIKKVNVIIEVILIINIKDLVN